VSADDDRVSFASALTVAVIVVEEDDGCAAAGAATPPISSASTVTRMRMAEGSRLLIGYGAVSV
jgi:hypothetical protein